MASALDGLPVVAIEQAVAAPMYTVRLANAGARVIKVERVASRPQTHRRGPPERRKVRNARPADHTDLPVQAWPELGAHTDRIRVRSEERRVGNECVSTCRTRCAP